MCLISTAQSGGTGSLKRKPFLAKRAYDLPNMGQRGRTEYGVACESYILIGGASWNKLRQRPARPYLIPHDPVEIISDAGVAEMVDWSEAGYIETRKAESVHNDRLPLLRQTGTHFLRLGNHAASVRHLKRSPISHPWEHLNFGGGQS